VCFLDFQASAYHLVLNKDKISCSTPNEEDPFASHDLCTWKIYVGSRWNLAGVWAKARGLKLCSRAATVASLHAVHHQSRRASKPAFAPVKLAAGG
jgi:hypothetical protein